MAAVQSVLAQRNAELLVADGSSTDMSLSLLEELAAADRRVRIVSKSDRGPADALNKAFRLARGTLIGWLNADDLMPPGALARSVSAFNTHPEWLMVYGEGEEFNDETGLVQRYPTLPASVGLEGFRSHCFICQPTGSSADRWDCCLENLQIGGVLHLISTIGFGLSQPFLIALVMFHICKAARVCTVTRSRLSNGLG